MGILAPSADERVCDVQIGPDTLTVALMDGRSISVPLAWFPRLLDATPEQRALEPAGASYGTHWPDLDEDLRIMQSDRSFVTDRIRRDRATPDTKGKIVSWTKWVADSSEPFEIHYDRAVSFCVIEGRAEITFTGGTMLDVQKDDFVTITPDIRGIWTVIEPIANLYMYHDARSTA